ERRGAVMTAVVRLAVDNRSAKAPAAPAGLGTIGKAEWKRVAPLLMQDGALPPEIEGLLLIYAQNVERAQLAAKEIRKAGQTFKGPAGLKAHPMIRAEAVATQNALKYAKDLGLIAKQQKPSREPSSELDY